MRKHKNIAKHITEVLITLTMCVGGTLSAVAADDEATLARDYVRRAEGYVTSESWDAAKRVIDEGLKKAPDDPDLRYLNGQYYYYGEKNLQQARYNLIKAIQESDHHYKARRLLVDVEEDSEHYSSAICYINELLEYEPYDRTLWRRKISLYNKIGHTEEADEALLRLTRIYPNDSVIRKDLSMRNRVNWQQDMPTKDKSLAEKVTELELYIDVEPTVDYYKSLIDSYYKLGEFDRAIGTALRGLEDYPKNEDLATTAAGMLAAKGLYSQALGLLKSTGRQGRLYSQLLEEAAGDARLRDPYDVSGRLYATTGNREALIYLLNTSITRGYYDDAHEWLREAYKVQLMDTTDLLQREYALEKRFGTEQTMINVLQRMEARNMLGTDRYNEFRDDYASLMLKIADNDMEHGEWANADLHLRIVSAHLSPDSEAWPTAIARRITALGKMNRLAEARALIDQADAATQEYVDRINAERIVNGSDLLTLNYRPRFAAAYEEVVASRLKVLMEEEKYEEALAEAEALLAIMPESEVAIRSCINMSQTLKRDDLFHQYAETGYRLFPEMPYFIVKHAVSLQQQGRIDEAMALLRPDSDADTYVNQQLVAAYAGITEEYASELLKAKKPEAALLSIDEALKYDPKNKDLLYMKGLAYEQMKRADLAYDYLKHYYEPSNAEQLDWEEHMRFLRFSGYRNRIDVAYSTAFYDMYNDELSSVKRLYSLASVSYSRLCRLNTFTGQVSYKGVDGYRTENDYEKGGVGLEFTAQWDHTFNHRWSGMINASYGTRFFNQVGANISAAYNANHDWTVGLRFGYRRTAPTYFYMSDEDTQVEYKRYNLFILTPSVSKTWNHISTSLGADLSLLRRSFFYNVFWKGKIFINEDNISSVGLMAGFGSFPELTFFDQASLRNVAHTNAMVGVDFTYLITHNFFLGLTGSWNTFYNPIRLPDGSLLSSARNIYTVNLSLHLAF